MLSLKIAGAVLAFVAADAAVAQQRIVQHGAGYPMPGAGAMQHRAPVIVHRQNGGQHLQAHGGRWGSKVGGRWWGGANAPGGWQAYHRPVRGYGLPSYWIAPRFYIDDWGDYGLDQPPTGYRWSRYYDDAVLIDSRGSVRDAVDGVDWDGDEEGYGGPGDDGPPPPGPGFGPPPPHGAGFPPPPPPPPYHGAHGGDRWVSPDGMTTVTTSSGTIGGHYNYYSGPGSTVTVTVETAPVVTTTTTETYDDVVTYRRPHAKVWHKKRVWKAKPRCSCR